MRFRSIYSHVAVELSSSEILGIAMKDILLELLLIIDRNLQNLQIDDGAFIERLPNELEVDNRFIPIEVLVLILDLEDQLVYSVTHSDHHPVILQ